MDLEDFLSSSYKTDNFEKFIFEKFHGFEARNSQYLDEELSESEKKHIKRFRYIDKVELDDDSEIGFFELESTSPHIENKRVAYANVLKKLANDYGLDGAIASFYHPDSDVWRLSFVGFEYDEGREFVTNLKRYTYVLGKDVAVKTPLEQLKSFQYPNYNELVEAFGVERVSKDFFVEYKKLYFSICDDLEPQLALFGNEKNLKLFVKKLLGRIVFLYFLQKKGWLDSDENWENGDRKFLSKRFKEDTFNNFYFDRLSPIFFEALNTKREDDYFKKLDCKMPFLNGGLFNEDEFDKKGIILDNSMFENIFNVFDRYNFTIIEDSPTDSEIAIDPEMLGRVFEDLLEDRKDKGAFYTPREIVHYMAKKSIENYLKTEVKEHDYNFSVEEFLHKTTLSDDEVLSFYKSHPVKFVKIDNYFEKLHPYKNLIVDFYIVAKLRGFLLNSDGSRTKGKKGHLEITTDIWRKILINDYEVVSVSFGSNKEIKLTKTYKYPSILKYIKLDDRYFILAFLPNIWGDLELTTIFPTRYKEIKRKLKIFDKSIQEINKENFVFTSSVFKEIKELQEDCRSLHAEPLSLFQVEELPRQAVAQVIKQGLSTFYNSFKVKSLADNSLKALLQNKNYYDKFINKLLSNSNTPQDELKKIMIIVLKKIKVLDPAIGSGAFPMGVLHEIVDARTHLGDKTPISKMKREIIENSIYGVDIEQSAVEIAKLRFWISIVVDEEKPLPLPNLFYKIMVGNSLLETVNGFDPLSKDAKSLFDDDESLIDAMQEKLHNYFKESDTDKKDKLQKSIEDTIDKVLGTKLQKHEDEIKSQVNNISITDFDNKQYKLIIQLNEEIKLIEKVLKRPTTELFFYKLYFKEVMDEGGFDVVIGNPPYVRQEKIKELKSKEEIQDFKSYNGTADLYIYFFEKGYKLLKPNGVLSYITSNKYTRAKYGKDFRKFLLENTNILEYIDFNGVKVFESAAVDTSIITYRKSQEKNSSFTYCDVDKSYKKDSELIEFIDAKGFGYTQSDLSIDSFSFASPQELRIKKQIEKIGTPLKEWDIKINYGIKTGLNEAFIIDGKMKDELIAKDIKSAEIIKPLLRGRDIKKYTSKFEDKWIICTFPSLQIDINEYQAVNKHLQSFGKKLEQSGVVGSRKKTGNKWFETQDQIAYHQEFKKERIFYNEIGNSIEFVPVKKEMYCNNKLYFITFKEENNDTSLNYLSAFLNSNTLQFYFDMLFNFGGGKGRETFQKVPIPQIDQKRQKPFEILVDYILFAKEQDMKNEASLFESIIDGMVYDLYFEEDMKKADCFITTRVTEIVKPWSKYDNDEFKHRLVSVIYDIFKEDKTVQRGLIFSRNIEVVKVINGDAKND